MAKRTNSRLYNNLEEGIAFGNRLREIRLKEGLTLDQLAFEAGVDLSTIYRIEKAKMVITLDLVFSLAKALKVLPKDLLDFQKTNPPLFPQD